MLRTVARTHPGARNGPNQDAVGMDESRQLAFVADGMGGYASGEVASDLVRKTLLETTSSGDIVTSVMSAHARIKEAAEVNPEYAGMGSTVVTLQVVGRRGKIVWVGDSRGYLWRHGTLRPLTRDHSVAEVLREAENLSETQIRVHPLRHKILQSLGKDDPTPSVADLPLRRHDWILLCSDGLSGELRDSEIAKCLAAHDSIDSAADGLVNDALASGGKDNISVVLSEYSGPRSWSLEPRLGERAVVGVSLLIGSALAAAVTGIVWWFTRRK